MENQPSDIQNTNQTTAVTHKNGYVLPLIALCLHFLPLLFVLISSLVQGLYGAIYFLIIISLVAGLVIGVISLCWGKKRIGTVGMTLAIIAVVLPLAWVVLILVFFIGAATGVISLM